MIKKYKWALIIGLIVVLVVVFVIWKDYKAWGSISDGGDPDGKPKKDDRNRGGQEVKVPFASPRQSVGRPNLYAKKEDGPRQSIGRPNPYAKKEDRIRRDARVLKQNRAR